MGRSEQPWSGSQQLLTGRSRSLAQSGESGGRCRTLVCSWIRECVV